MLHNVEMWVQGGRNVEMWVQGGRNVEMWDREGSGALGRGNKGTRAGSVAAVDRVLASFL